MSVDVVISYPANCEKQWIVENIQKNCKAMNVEITSDLKPVYFDKESKYVEILSKVYEEIMGLDGTPVTTMGVTYAKVFPNILPFGPSFPNQKGIGHLPNEWI